MFIVQPVYRPSPFENYFSAATGFTTSLRSYADAAPPADKVADSQKNFYGELTNLDPLTRARYVRDIMDSSLSKEEKSSKVGLLYLTYRTNAERMGKLLDSARDFTAAIPGKLTELKEKLQLTSLNAYTALGEMSWNTFKNVYVTIARLAADSLHVPMPDLYVSWNPYSTEIASYEPDSDRLVVNLGRLDQARDLEKATLHEMTHAEQKQKTENATLDDGAAAMLAANQDNYFGGGGRLYRANPLEQEAFATMSVIEQAFPALV